jgi:hypothetical protein
MLTPKERALKSKRGHMRAARLSIYSPQRLHYVRRALHYRALAMSLAE